MKKTRFFWKKTDEPFYYVGTDTFSGSARGGENIVDTKGMVEVFSKEYFFKTLMNFMVGCHDIKDQKPDLSQPSCYWAGTSFLQYSGYSTANRSIIKRLFDYGANVKAYTNVTEIDIPLEEALQIARSAHVEIPKGSPCVHNTTFTTPRKTYCVHFTMSEYSDVPNDYHKKILEMSDELWVPSEWDKQKFLSCGLDRPVMVVPLGIDPKVFCPENKGKVVFSGGLNEFVFISVCALNWRKGHDVLLKAYNRAFSSKDNVSLLFLTHGYELLEDVAEAVRRDLGIYMGSDAPHVSFCFSKIQEEALPAIYNSAHAYVQFTRGEGWGLPYNEAIGCGLPVIGVYHGGQKEFLREEDSFLIKPDQTAYAPKKEQELIGMYKDVRFADFSEKKIDEAAEKMRYVYENYDKCKSVAEKARERISRDFTWDKSAKMVYNRLVQLQPV